ncbi:MAG: S8 family serine peptidase [Acidobacteriota bacterium]
MNVRGILDTGIQQDHPKLDHVTYESTHGTTDTDGHGTKVAGIIYSNHSDYRGMAYGLDRVLVGDCLNFNVYDHADWMVGARGDDPEAINLSCGYGRANGSDYASIDKSIDDSANDYQLYRGTMFRHEKATVTWHRHSTYNGTNTPTNILDLSDLDLYAYAGDDGSLIDSSTSHIDNVEQIAASADGDTVIKVAAYGSFDSALASQEYALATEENFQKVNPPSLSLSASNVTVNTSLFDPVPVGPWVTVNNTGGAPAHSITATATISGDWTLLNTSNPMASIDSGDSFPTAFTAMTRCTSTGESQTVTVTVTSESYGETFTATTSYTITCG